MCPPCGARTSKTGKCAKHKNNIEDKVLSGSLKQLENKKINFIELEIMLDEVYEKTMSFYEIENILKDNYKLYGVDYQGFKNLSEGYMFALDVLYIKK